LQRSAAGGQSKDAEEAIGKLAKLDPASQDLPRFASGWPL
jgi:hypothetical protein